MRRREFEGGCYEESDSVLESLEGKMGQWDVVTTEKKAIDRFWRPKIHAETLVYVKCCNPYQHMSPLIAIKLAFPDR